jgi:hypothetical protein
MSVTGMLQRAHLYFTGGGGAAVAGFCMLLSFRCIGASRQPPVLSSFGECINSS